MECVIRNKIKIDYNFNTCDKSSDKFNCGCGVQDRGGGAIIPQNCPACTVMKRNIYSLYNYIV